MNLLVLFAIATAPPAHFSAPDQTPGDQTPGQALQSELPLVGGAAETRGQALRRDQGPDTVVVCPPELVSALDPWLEFRSSQGHKLQVIKEYQTAEDIRSQIRGVAEHGTLRNVVLVGDTAPTPQGFGPVVRPLPTHLAPAVVNVRWGSEPEIATDNWYADLDDDGLPELTIGRIPVETPEELARVIQKIRAYEERTPPGLWCRRINLVAGLGGFGLLTDTLLETATRSLIARGIPAEYQTSMTYASWRSPYCPDPRSFRQKVLQRLNEGCLLWVYMGHGRRQGLDWIRVPIGVAPILEREDVEHVRCPTGPPIAVFLSCYTAAFDDPEDCLAERLLLQEAGPVAVLGGSRVTLPYGMAVLGSLLMEETFQNRRPTLGEVVLESKRRLGAEWTNGPDASWLDLVARVASPTAGQLAEERREHVLLFNLLGDPLLRLPQPLPIDVRAAGSAAPGQALAIECDSPLTGEGVVELVCPRGRFTFSPPSRTEFDGSDAGMRALNGVYERAREDYFVQQSVRSDSRRFQTTIPIPEAVRGPCVLRVYLGQDRSHALGSTTVQVMPPATVVPKTAAEPVLDTVR